jgi:hypothetical protein
MWYMYWNKYLDLLIDIQHWKANASMKNKGIAECHLLTKISESMLAMFSKYLLKQKKNILRMFCKVI